MPDASKQTTPTERNAANMTKELYNLGEMPPLGVIPPKMHAWLIRP
jgi:hypothetical protein